jgi:hypothetical protein
MKKGFVFYSLLCFCSGAFAQIMQPNAMQNMQQVLFKDNIKKQNIESDYNNVKGSPYLTDHFSKGELHTSNGIYKDLDMKYDIYEGTFLLKINNQNNYLDQNQSTRMVLCDGKRFYLKNLGTASKPKHEFLILVDSSQVSLFVKKNVSLRPEEPPKAMETQAHPAEFVKQKDSYYIQLGTGNMILIENPKDLYAIFADKANGLKELIKKEKLSFKKEEDVVKMMQYCNGTL